MFTMTDELAPLEFPCRYSFLRGSHTTSRNPLKTGICRGCVRASKIRDAQLLGVAWVQHDGEDAGLPLRPGRARRHPVQAPGRLVERLPGLEHFRGQVVDGPLVLALQDVAEHRAGVAVRLAALT